MDDRSKSILLEGLKHEQSQCLLFVADARRNPQIREGIELEWALQKAVSVYRDLRDNRISHREAFEQYCEIARITTAYDTAAYMALEFTPYVPTTAAQIALRDELLAIVNPRKDAA